MSLQVRAQQEKLVSQARAKETGEREKRWVEELAGQACDLLDTTVQGLCGATLFPVLCMQPPLGIKNKRY
jgi:hypothetical protein